MGIEGGPSGGGVAGAAPVSGLARFDSGPAFGAAPVAGSIINEGPVGLKDLKATVPLQTKMFNPVGEIRFNSQPQLNAAEAISEAELILAQARGKQVESVLPETRPAILPQIEPIAYLPFEPMIAPVAVPVSLEFPKPEVIIAPAVKPQIKTENALGSKTEAFNQAKLIVLPQSKLEGQEAEEVREEVVKQDQKQTLEEEELAERKIYLEDGEVSAQRKQEIREAIVKAKVEADRLGLKKITGALVAKFLPPEHEGNRSQIVKKSGPDGSYQETVETIAQVGELESERKALERLDGVVAEKKPVKYGKDGLPVSESDVARVLKYRVVKSAPEAHAEVVKRVVKKQVQVSPVVVAENKIKPENTLEDLGLAEVFPKAA